MKKLDFTFECYEKNISAKYYHEPFLESFLNQMSYAYKWSKKNLQLYSVFSDNTSAFLMKKNKRDEEAFFGFVNTTNNHDLNILWTAVLAKCKELNIKSIKGPVQGSTFFPYRFVTLTDDSPFFDGECFSRMNEDDFMKNQKPKKIIEYGSAIRTNFNNILKFTKPYFDNFKNKNFIIKHMKKVDDELLKSVHSASNVIFKNNWGFHELSFDDFKRFFKPSFNEKFKISFYSLYYNEQLIGFSKHSEFNEETLVCKTLGLIPEYQKMGIGNAFAYKLHADVMDCNYKNVIYALVKKDNRVTKMPTPDLKIIREYSAYEFEI